MHGLLGLISTSGEDFISTALLEIYLLRKIVTCSILFDLLTSCIPLYWTQCVNYKMLFNYFSLQILLLSVRVGTCVLQSRTILLRLDHGLVALFASLRVGEDHLQADVGVGRQVAHHVSGGFGVHLQAVGFALVGFVVVVADGDIEGVAAGDVVAQ